MPKYLVKTPHIHEAGKHVQAGDVVHLDRKEGEHRVAIGFVEPYNEPAPPAAEPKKGKVGD